NGGQATLGGDVVARDLDEALEAREVALESEEIAVEAEAETDAGDAGRRGRLARRSGEIAHLDAGAPRGPRQRPQQLRHRDPVGQRTPGLLEGLRMAPELLAGGAVLRRASRRAAQLRALDGDLRLELARVLALGLDDQEPAGAEDGDGRDDDQENAITLPHGVPPAAAPVAGAGVVVVGLVDVPVAGAAPAGWPAVAAAAAFAGPSS